MRSSSVLLIPAFIGLASACGGDPAAPAGERVRLDVHGDTVVFAAPGTAAPVQVVARTADSGDPADDVDVTWRVVSGSGAVSPASDRTGADGAAAATVSAAQQGTVIITAGASGLAGTAPRIPVHFVTAPTVTGVAGGVLRSGQDAVVTGTGFSTIPAHNVVTFSGVRGTVLEASATELRVRVPACLPTRNVDVRAALGSLAGAAWVTVANEGPSGTVLALQPGEVAGLATADALSCVGLASAGGAVYMITVHNVDVRHGPDVQLQVRALGATDQALEESPTSGTHQPAHAWEAALRAREQQLRGAADPFDLLQETTARVPVAGEQRTFNVLNRDNRFDRVTAEVRLVTPRAVLWVDVSAAESLTAADLQGFADVFEDPIHDGMVEVFGAPSDVDGDERIGIVFTPGVNRLTPRNSSSFIGGYFYGCDLVSRARCSGTNSGEFLYSMVPDPTAAWGDARSRASVLAAVPPVLAHEFQHMISFARRGFSSDALWLSEGLAHAAEHVVADLLDQRGDASGANGFRTGNRNRAARYLRSPRTVRLLSAELPGTLEQRGAAWLFLEYLQAHHGGRALLRTLTGASTTGVGSITAAAARPWEDLWSDFGVALWADGAPGIAGGLAARYTFGDYDIRKDLADPSYPLNPVALPWRDFNHVFTLGSGGHAHLQVTSSVADPPLSIVVADPRGGDPGRTVRASVLRIR